MKRIKKLCSLLLAMIMVLAMAVPAMADTTGTITITNASAGHKYTAYKVFDATYDAVNEVTAYSVKEGALKNVVAAAEGKDGNKLFVVGVNADSDGNYSVSAAEGALDGDILAWLEENVALFTKKAETTLKEGNTVVFDVPYGYYYITSDLGATVTVDTNTPNARVIDKNTTSPNIPEGSGKKVVDADGNVIEQSTASIGETVHFKVSFSATNFVTDEDGNTTQITEYTIVDTPAGMKIDTDTVAVKVGNADVSVAANNISVDADGKMTITLPWAEETDEKDAEGNKIYANIYESPVDVVITYSAEITAAAAEGTATNKVTINYNGEYISSETETKTYSITVNKVDKDNNALTGAEFELYDALENGNKINLVAVEENNEVSYYRVATPEEIASEGFVSAKVVAGTATIKGLKGNTDYYLEEVKAPDGYNMLTKREKVTTATPEGDETIAANVTSNVVNKAGALLPSTGGMGTRLFYLVGGILVVAAGVLLVSRKRMEREN